MISYYHLEYFALLLQVLFAIAMAAGMVGTSYFIGRKVKNRIKDMPYECGFAPVGSAQERFSVKFYLVAMVFILFDIEAIFLYPWVTVYRDLGIGILVEMVIFIALVLFGYFYILKSGVLDWSDTKPETESARAEAIIKAYAVTETR